MAKKVKLTKALEAAYNHVDKVAVPQADGYHGNVSFGRHERTVQEAFIAGAKWQHEQDVKALDKFFE
jgi:hypothetical protein